MQNIIELSKVVHALKEEKSILKNQLSELETQLEFRQKELYALMEKAEISSLRVDGIGNVIQVDKHRAQITDKTAFFDWLKETDQEFIITRTVNANTLDTLSKEYLSENFKDLPGCKSFIKQSITIRKG